MDAIDVQRLFFSHIKGLLPAHISVVDEVAALLKISNDSVYRRMRGEKPLSFDEVQTLCGHFEISLDSVFGLDGDNYSFSGKLVNDSNFQFDQFLKKMLADMEVLARLDQPHMYFVNRDLPLFHQFQVPELAAFKFFFWMKTVLGYNEMINQQFSFDKISSGFEKISQKIASVYCEIPSTEIWNMEAVSATLIQIDYYRDTGFFTNTSDAIRLYDAVAQVIGHIKDMASKGDKFPLCSTPGKNAAQYTLYNNEVILGDNTIFITAKDTRITYINHSVINYMATRNVAFCDHIWRTIQNTIRRSSPISATSDKDRNRFFDGILENISRRKAIAEAM